MSKIKVLQIGGNTQKNGITSYLLNTYEHMSDKYQFIFINTAYRESDIEVERKIIQLGGKIYNLPYKGDFTDIEAGYRNIIVKEIPDVVHSHYFYSNGDFLRVANEEHVPIRISHCHNDKSGYLNLEEQGKLLSSRELCEQHATLKLAVTANAGSFLYNDYNFTISRMVIDYDKFYKLNDNGYIHYKFGLDESIKYSIFIGRFTFQKNVFFFIELLKHFNDRELIMIGEGPKKEVFVRTLIENNLLDKVVFMKDENINELLNISDTFLLPSFYEGASISLIEAQLAGVYCIASNKMSNDSNIGNVKYLDLDVRLWIEEIETKKSYNNSMIDRDILSYNKVILEYSDYYSNEKLLSQYYLNLAKEYKLGSERVYNDWEKVVKYYCKAHKLGSDKATFYLALQYFEGLGVNKDKVMAEQLLSNVMKEIVNKSLMEETDYLLISGDMYSFGFGKEKNLDMAYHYYIMAAQRGNLEAMCNLGYIFEVGAGIAMNLEESFKWYNLSANRGYLHSMRDVGLCYLYGIGTNMNLEKAVDWFEKASKQNYAHATTDLAHCYYEGLGVDKSISKAIQLFNNALLQDVGRTKRDLISHRFSIDSLINESKLEIIEKIVLTEVNDIDSNILVGNTIIINKYIEDIKPNIFYNNRNIDKFFVEKDNDYYYSYNGVLYSKDLKTLIRFPLGLDIDVFVIPNHVEIIGDSAFDDCKSLVRIKIPISIKEIGNWAFHGCDKLRNLVLPKNVEKIGVYAFGSCESLLKIEVLLDNKHYKDIDGNLYTKDGTILLQYATGKSEKLFVLPKEASIIEFRAFSDAYNLEYVDLKNAEIVMEKAFYWCSNLKEILVNKNCVFDGKMITSKTQKEFKISYRKIGRILLVADIHGHLRLDFLKNKLDEVNLNEHDSLIILGDAGIVFDEEMNEKVKQFYEIIPCEIYFLDGNHENFELLNRYPKISKNGSLVHQVLPNVFHLMRGETYLINSHKFFVFGGAYSIKREDRTSSVKVWKEELPNNEEYSKARYSFEENNFNFDYILTHQAPKMFLDKIEYKYSKNESLLLDFLDYVSINVKYKKWYFGHIHRDIVIDNITGIYNESVVISYDE